MAAAPSNHSRSAFWRHRPAAKRAAMGMGGDWENAAALSRLATDRIANEQRPAFMISSVIAADRIRLIKIEGGSAVREVTALIRRPAGPVDVGRLTMQQPPGRRRIAERKVSRSTSEAITTQSRLSFRPSARRRRLGSLCPRSDRRDLRRHERRGNIAALGSLPECRARRSL